MCRSWASTSGRLRPKSFKLPSRWVCSKDAKDLGSRGAARKAGGLHASLVGWPELVFCSTASAIVDVVQPGPRPA